MSGTEAQAAAERFAAAHRALRADPAVQFTLPPVAPRPPPPRWLVDALHWLGRHLRPLARFVRRIGGWLPDGPYAQILLWSVVGLLAVSFGWMAYQRVRHGEWRLPHRRRAAVGIEATPEEEEAWRPDAAPVLSWLRQADALAAEGRFAEAAHLLLFRSIEDIARHRPRLVRPALTAREIAAAAAIPSGVRGLFAGIAALVERSLFGGRPVDAADWSTARAAYADLALPRSWRA